MLKSILLLIIVILTNISCETKKAIYKNNESPSIDEIIRQTYYNRLKEISPYKRSHFAIRHYRITGQNDLNIHIESYFNLIKENLYLDLKNYNNKDYVFKRGEYFCNDLINDEGDSKRGELRQKTFRDNKDILFYLKLIETSYIWADMGFLKGEHKKDFEEWLNYLRSLDLRSIFLNDKFMRTYSTPLISRIFYLKHHKVIDLVNDFKVRFQKLHKDPLDDFYFRNKIYTLTHFIIAASNFYQKIIPQEEFQWIIDYFNENIQSIIERTNVDIISEVGICYKLVGIKSSKEIDIISNYIAKAFDKKLGYIATRGGTLDNSEHTNIVALLFLKKFENLYKGPTY
ncbi:MAG: DUF3541 domain-containing protein [Spirochaetota bacterium]|nr:DUF3541 domain-containing protein [Spirochaetota bacterium]